MGITMFGFGSLLAPLQSLMGWLAQGPRRQIAPVRPRGAAAHAHPVASRACLSRSAAPGACRDRPSRPLRVVRVMEGSNRAPSGSGRMVISGRMADVCAELDRLAALEAAAS